MTDKDFYKIKNQDGVFTIQTPKEFSFQECYTFINRSLNECLHYASDNRIRKLIKIYDKFFLLEINSNSNKHLRLNFLNSKPSKKEILFVKNFIGDWFDLSTDLMPFYKFASRDKFLKPITKKYFGLRLIGIPDLFEALTWAITGQQINLSFAYTLKRKLVEKYGEKFFFEDKNYFLYPSAEKISRLSKRELLKLQFSGNKAEYIIGIAKAIEDKKISKEELQKLSFENAKEKLLKLHGVGNWTANYVIMKCLKNKNAFPIEDVGLHNAIKNQLKLETKPSIEQIKKLSSNWNGWYAYSTFYLWRSLLDL